MLADCDECGKKISDEARRCPHCGFNYYYVFNGGYKRGGWTGYKTEVVKNGSGYRRMSPVEYVEFIKKKIEEGQRKARE